MLALKIENARKYMPPNDVNVVVYHKNCQDGEAAALCAWRILGDDNVYYYTMQYSDKIDIDKFLNKNVLLLDFSWSKSDLENVRSVANKVMILDHHKTAMEELGDIHGCFFDMDESGASLSWRYFDDGLMPLFIQFIKDRDIWAWKYRKSSEPMYYGLKNICYNSFRFLDRFIENEDMLDNLIISGIRVMDRQKEWIKEITKEAKLCTMKVGNSKYKVVQLKLEKPKFVSEIGEYLYNTIDVDFVVIWFLDKNSGTNGTNGTNYNVFKWYYGTQKYIMSFRTNKEDVDVSKIAVYFGGGGHQKAAGAKVDYSPDRLFNIFDFLSS